MYEENQEREGKRGTNRIFIEGSYGGRELTSAGTLGEPSLKARTRDKKNLSRSGQSITE